MAAPRGRVLNVSTGGHVKLGQAEGWVEQGVAVWEKPGASVRMLTFPEMVARRMELSRAMEPAPLAELRGCLVVGIEDIRSEVAMAWQGTLFLAPAVSSNGQIMKVRENAR